MSNYFINTSIFYILSGPSASGKSSLTNQLIAQGLPNDAIVSTDTIRKQILGSYLTTDQHGVKETLHGWKNNQPEIFSIIDNILSLRLQQRLPTFFDATNLNDEARTKYVQMGKKYGVDAHIIIFDVEKEVLKERLIKRKERFDINVLDKQLETFSLNSIYPFTVVKPDDQFTLLPNLLNTTNIDILGDTHGLLDETILLLNNKGWVYDGHCFKHPDPLRKLLFLGDVVDRGTQSIELIEAVRNTVNNGDAFFIIGNHEAKLLSSYYQYKNEGVLRGKSLSSSETLLKLVALAPEKQEQIYQFLLNSPTHYCLWIDKTTGQLTTSKDNSIKIAFAHADNEFYDPYKFLRSNALYGSNTSGSDNDQTYQNNFNNSINEYIYIRGHVENKSLQNSLYSLEDNQAFAGHLVCLDLPNYLQSLKNNNYVSEHRLFEENIMKYKTEFNFNEHIKNNVLLLKKMNELVKTGLAFDGPGKDANGKKPQHPDGFRIYKYQNKVHYKKLWKTDPMLEKARGLVLDIAGNIVVHPFDKLYNYGEYNAGKELNPTDLVQAVEKLNGFLGCISKHPFREELLFSTTGSLTSDFINYIKDFVDPEMTKKLLEYFKTNKQTLMFEVIHPQDEHIIKYEPHDHGLWLIGARGLKIEDKPVSEAQLDTIGKTLNFRRPKWYVAEFKDILTSLPCSHIEGHMIRNATNDEHITKIKSSYYLVTKFIGRLGDKKIDFMYKSPEKFKETSVEEEFYPIVDEIVKTTSKEEFSQMPEKTRTQFVRNIVDKQRNQVGNKTLAKP